MIVGMEKQNLLGSQRGFCWPSSQGTNWERMKATSSKTEHLQFLPCNSSDFTCLASNTSYFGCILNHLSATIILDSANYFKTPIISIALVSNVLGWQSLVVCHIKYKGILCKLGLNQVPNSNCLQKF